MADRRYIINAFTVNLEPSPSGLVRPADSDTLADELRRTADELLGLLAESDVQGTFFTSDSVTVAATDAVKKISDAGHEIALLSPRFHSPMDQLLRFRDEVARAKSRLEDAIGKSVTGFRFTPLASPGKQSPAMIETLVQQNFLYSSSTFPPRNFRPGLVSGKRKAYRLHTASGMLWEIPLTAWRPFGIGFPSIRTAGGPSLSYLPVWAIARGVEGMNRHGEPAVLYAHSWALNPANADWSKLPVREQLVQYGQRDETLATLKELFEIYRFGNTLDAFASRLTMSYQPEPRATHRTGIIRCA